jgi:hypothetical protein
MERWRPDPDPHVAATSLGLARAKAKMLYVRIRERICVEISVGTFLIKIGYKANVVSLATTTAELSILYRIK